MYGLFRYRPRIVSKAKPIYYFTPSKQVTILPNKMSASVNHYMTLNIGDKIKIVAKNTYGNAVRTTAQSVRLRIRRKL